MNDINEDFREAKGVLIHDDYLVSFLWSEDGRPCLALLSSLIVCSGDNAFVNSPGAIATISLPDTLPLGAANADETIRFVCFSPIHCKMVAALSQSVSNFLLPDQ
jgi:hypothetical protein